MVGAGGDCEACPGILDPEASLGWDVRDLRAAAAAPYIRLTTGFGRRLDADGPVPASTVRKRIISSSNSMRPCTVW